MVKQLPTSRPETHQRTLHAGEGLHRDDPVHPSGPAGGRDPREAESSASADCSGGSRMIAVPRLPVIPPAGPGPGDGDGGGRRYTNGPDGATSLHAGVDDAGRNRVARRASAQRHRSNKRILRDRGAGPIDREAGMATAEYAIATLAAVGFAALLVAVLSSGEIKGLLMSLIASALNFG